MKKIIFRLSLSLVTLLYPSNIHCDATQNNNTEQASSPTENNSSQTTDSKAKKTKLSAKQTQLQNQKKRGGELYQEYATALHSQRFRPEFTAAQWKTILLQKRIRIPLTGQDHRDLQKFFINE